MIEVYEEFSGWGGSADGINAVPGFRLRLAANHKKIATDVYGLNHPDTDVYLGDIAKADIATFPPCDFFWASPSCPAWTNARGVKRTFDQANQGVMFEDNEVGVRQDEAAARRSRALMEEIPRYLDAMHTKGKPALAGVVENVIECRKWSDWKPWLRQIEALGYKTRVIALNAAHVHGRKTGRVPQSRDRLFVGYWQEKLGRDPDWDKWLRPRCWCPRCQEWVAGVQAWKVPGRDMGRYGVKSGSYVYRCPRVTCRGLTVQPDVVPALQAIDLTRFPGHTIGERLNGIGRRLEEATLRRIRIGWERYGRPMLSPAGGTWRDAAVPLDVPMPARTTRECDGVVLPPGALSTPFIAELRGGGSKTSARAATDPLSTVSAQGFHHGLVTDGLPGLNEMLVPYYRTGTAAPTSQPMGTLTTKDRFALVSRMDRIAFEDLTFRMLAAPEVGAGMAFRPDYKVLGDATAQICGYGNAVPPPMSEVLTSALAEAITGEDLEPAVA